MNARSNDKKLILVTGSTGLIGKKVVEAFAPNHTVVGLDIDEPEDFPGQDWFQCDLTKDESVDESLDRVRERYGGNVTGVVHLAAFCDFSGEPSRMYGRLTVEGTERIIRKLQDFERVEQFIFSSSLLVMKPVEEKDNRLTEKSPTQAEWPYPRSKLAAESILKKEHKEIPVVVLRIAGVYDEDCHSLPISQHIKRICEKKMESYFFPGDPDHGQPFVHMDDLVNCLEKTFARRHELDPYQIFLIAEPDVLSHEQLQDRLGELIHGKEWPTIRVPKPVAKAGAKIREQVSDEETFIKPWMVDLADDHYPVEINRASAQLGWEPNKHLGDVLEEMVRRLKQDPKKWYELNNLELPENWEKKEEFQEMLSAHQS